MKWSTQAIVAGLKKAVPSATITTEERPQGERYCRDIYMKFDQSEYSDGITIVGFRDDIDTLSDVDQPEQDIALVEVRTFHSDSNGGLPKRAPKHIREAYNATVDYFNEQQPPVEAINNLKDFF